MLWLMSENQPRKIQTQQLIFQKPLLIALSLLENSFIVLAASVWSDLGVSAFYLFIPFICLSTSALVFTLQVKFITHKP